MGDLGYCAICYDCGKEFLCGEHFLSYPPIERVCYHCALKRLNEKMRMKVEEHKNK